MAKILHQTGETEEGVHIIEENESFVRYIDGDGETVSLTWDNIIEVRQSATEQVPPEDKHVIERTLEESDSKEQATKRLIGASQRHAINPLTEPQAKAIVDELY